MEGWNLLEAKERCDGADIITLLVQGKIAGRCRIGAPDAESLTVPFDAWKDIQIDNENAFISRQQSQVQLYELRIFPILHVPNAAELLYDRSLADVFMEAVVRDPEVIGKGKKVIAQRPGDHDVFDNGRVPGPFVDYHWPIDAVGPELAYDFVRILIHFPGVPEPRPSEAVLAVADILADRIAALRGLLSSGRLNAIGTHRNSGVVSSIHKMQWQRTGQAINIQNGDLCEREAAKWTPVWTGIFFEPPPERLRVHTNLLFEQKLGEISRPSKVRSTSRAEAECTKWLRGIVENAPANRSNTKAELFREAKLKWPDNLSYRGFERSWSAATMAVSGDAWRSGGRPRKTSAPKT